MVRQAESKLTTLALLLLGLLVLGGCSQPESTETPAAETAAPAAKAAAEVSVDVLIAKAEALYLQAREKEHAWMVTSRSITEAREALADGDEMRARQAAEKAVMTAEASLKQAEDETLAWQDRVPK